jgi:hypothetical protein
LLAKCWSKTDGKDSVGYSIIGASMSAKIFISYRRDDSAGHAGRVHDRLEREYGRDLIFMDVDAIPLGANFVKVLGEEVAKCDVLLAIIGAGWLEARDDEGQRRLDNPNDFVRIEIAVALKRDIPVIPILLEGAKMPRADKLPEDLVELAVRNGLDVRHSSFHADIDKLIRGLKRFSNDVSSALEPLLPPDTDTLAVLMALGGSQEAVSNEEIARRMGVKKSEASKRVTSAVFSGYVRRERAGREVFISAIFPPINKGF